MSKTDTTKAIEIAWLVVTLLVFYTSFLNFTDRHRADFFLPSIIGGISYDRV